MRDETGNEEAFDSSPNERQSYLRTNSNNISRTARNTSLAYVLTSFV